MSEPDKTIRVIAQNRRARFEYEVLEELECGLVLRGTEVKSLRANRASIAEAYGSIRNNELWLIQSTIDQYTQGNVHNHVPARDRKLLASQREIAGWFAQVKVKGMTIVPLTLYFRGRRAKVLMALCKGKKMHDKRQSKREKDDRREIDRAMSRKSR